MSARCDRGTHNGGRQVQKMRTECNIGGIREGDANVPIPIYPRNELWTEVIREDERRIEVIRACAELRTGLNFP